MSDLDVRLGQMLEQRREKKRFRALKEYDTGGQSGLIDFSANDYLSMTTSKTARQNYLERVQASPSILGSTGSRLLSGGTREHQALESRLQEHFRAPAALLFNSGWDANVSFFSTVPQVGDWIIYDELVHASVHDGMRGSRVSKDRRVSFGHNCPKKLEEVLLRIKDAPGGSKAGTVFVALESLYSMDGDLARLSELLDVLDRHIPKDRHCVILDEAHTTGLYGEEGRGYACALGEEERVTVRLMTFGKGVGCSGAVLLCSPVVRSFLINFARPLIFSTALPHSTLLSLESAWDVLESPEGDLRREALFDLAAEFHDLVRPLLARATPKLLSLPPSGASFGADGPGLSRRSPHAGLSPIIGLLTPDPHALSAFLLERGYVVRPVVPPTVPPGGERVRICLRAEMGPPVVQGLVRALSDWVDAQTSVRSQRRGLLAPRAKL